jgi:hypothetical protein
MFPSEATQNLFLFYAIKVFITVKKEASSGHTPGQHFLLDETI